MNFITRELEFHDISDLTAANYERGGERENEGNCLEEIETFVEEQKSENNNNKKKQSAT